MTRQAGKMFLHFGVVLALLLAAGVAQGNNSGTFRGMVNKLKQTPVGSKVDSLMTKAGQRWQQRTAAALISATLICGGITGCGTDNPMSVSAQQVEYRAGEEIIYETANGELRLADVVTDHGTMLTIAPYKDTGEIEISESKALGYANPPTSASTFTFAKGRHLDAYGDKYAEIEFLHGGMTTSYWHPNGDAPIAAEIKVAWGTNAAGEEIDIYDRIYVLVRRSEYSW